jgi:hypothetical protein
MKNKTIQIWKRYTIFVSSLNYPTILYSLFINFILFILVLNINIISWDRLYTFNINLVAVASGLRS